MSNKMLDLSFYMDAARVHGEDSEPDHEVGDLQTYMQVMWELLTPEQRKAFAVKSPATDLLWQVQ